MTIPVFLKSYKSEVPNDGYWDYGMFKELLNKQLWDPVDGYEFELNTKNQAIIDHLDIFNSLGYCLTCQIKIAGENMSEHSNSHIITPNSCSDGGIVVIPGRYHFDKTDEINADIACLKWVLIVIIGDEDGAFPTEKLKHPNMKVWLMLPHDGTKKNVDRYLPNGWPTGTREYLKQFTKQADKRRNDWFFSGQITHKRRRELITYLHSIESVYKGKLIETEGFTQGLPHKEYFKEMARAKIVPCPSGAVIPDSFRLYEALEAGCLPLADNKSPNGKGEDFWHLLFGEKELPFPIVNDWSEAPLAYHIDTYPKAANLTYAWWQQKKREMAYWLQEDIKQLSGLEPEVKTLKDKITVIMPTSYVQSHPDSSCIEETLRTIRERLPDSEIIITFDGLREEQKEGEAVYQEYIRKMLFKLNFEFKNIIPIVFKEHTHQIGMAREALNWVKTPTILYVEHDAPLCEHIPFEELVSIIEDKHTNLIRLHHEALVLEVHKHLMLDKEPIEINGIPLVRTGQWSQRPHLASTEFYKRVLNQELRPEAKGMIEDGIIGKPSQALLFRGQPGWDEWRLAIYAPPGDMKRSYHLDARGKESKFEETFKY